jgi:hypothetical protein
LPFTTLNTFALTLRHVLPGGNVKFWPAKNARLPDRQRLEHRALAAIVAPNQQIEPGKVVDLFTHGS